ncbi:hypothetical protein PHLGIDRAFT_34368 [Phlebiopsis gigantea 11061_1 CR5-6]|uniref:SAP domain-containing protein n=1 Tax=Phlebiopsis gigantea (strain 11061_1 CR5-6) TaxID=745531 RepID=A0A0C3S2N1_PHLG1|nr:hypothetical protein PHLGIDRAFT_34368 [Phlebiopsis gigantea 11061_1 CR5-6]
MLRHTLSSNVRHVSQRRGFVSTVLLTRDWENETVSALKKEAKKHGLLQTGNKATLITRLQEHGRAQAVQVPPPVTPARHASTEAPSASSSSSDPKGYLNVKIPDVSIPIVQKLAPVPFVPDLWDSSRVKAESSPAPVQDSTTPKIITVAGSDMETGDIVSHNLYPDLSPPTSAAPVKKGPVTELLHDLIPELSFVRLPGKAVPAELLEGVAETTLTSGKTDSSYSRSLDSDEKNGVWALLGLFAGSWVLAGMLSPSPIAETDQKPVPEKAADTH